MSLSYTPTTLDARGPGGLSVKGTLFETVRSDSPPWTIREDGQVVALILEKVRPAKSIRDFWPCLLRGGPRVDLRYLYKARRERGTLSPDALFREDELDEDDSNYFSDVT